MTIDDVPATVTAIRAALPILKGRISCIQIGACLDVEVVRALAAALGFDLSATLYTGSGVATVIESLSSFDQIDGIGIMAQGSRPAVASDMALAGTAHHERNGTGATPDQVMAAMAAAGAL